MGSEDFLSPVRALILQEGIGKSRKLILSKQLEKHGGHAVQTLSDSTTHVLVGKNTRLARVPALLKGEAIPTTASVLRADWLSSCLVKRQLVCEESYIVLPETLAKPPLTQATAVPPPGLLSPRLASSNSPESSGGSKPCPQGSTPRVEGGPSTADSDRSMSSPKAGMFAVTSRRWKKNPKKVKGKMDDADSSRGWNSSDSDYVESDVEEPEKEREGESVIGAQGTVGRISETCIVLIP